MLIGNIIIIFIIMFFCFYFGEIHEDEVSYYFRTFMSDIENTQRVRES